MLKFQMGFYYQGQQTILAFSTCLTGAVTETKFINEADAMLHSEPAYPDDAGEPAGAAACVLPPAAEVFCKKCNIVI